MPDPRRVSPTPFVSLLLLLVLQGCALVKVAYNQAETLMYWRLDGYADFTREQAPRVHASLAQFHQWHRRTQLPVYAELLQGIRPKLAEAISPELACSVFDQARSAANATLDPAQWTLVWMAAELSEDQLVHIEKKQASTDADWRKEWLIGKTPEKLLEARFEQALSRAEMLYGSLDRPQKAALRAGLAVSSFDARRSDAERQRRQHDLLNVLRKIRAEQLGTDQARALLTAYMVRALLPPDAADQRYVQALIKEGCATFSRLHNATTAAQRAKAAETLDRYATDFRMLAAQP